MRLSAVARWSGKAWRQCRSVQQRPKMKRQVPVAKSGRGFLIGEAEYLSTGQDKLQSASNQSILSIKLILGNEDRGEAFCFRGAEHAQFNTELAQNPL